MSKLKNLKSQPSKRKRSLIRFGVWKYYYKYSKSGKTRYKCKTSEIGKFIIYVDWYDDKDHQRIREKIRSLYPGYNISGYGLN